MCCYVLVEIKNTSFLTNFNLNFFYSNQQQRTQYRSHIYCGGITEGDRINGNVSKLLVQILIIEQFDHKQILIKSNISSETNYGAFVPDFTMMIAKKTWSVTVYSQRLHPGMH